MFGGGRRHGRRLPQIGHVCPSRRASFHSRIFQFACIEMPRASVAFVQLTCAGTRASSPGFLRISSLRGNRGIARLREGGMGTFPRCIRNQGMEQEYRRSECPPATRTPGAWRTGDPSRFPTTRWLRRSTGDKLRPGAPRVDVAAVLASACMQCRSARAASLKRSPVAESTPRT